MVTVLALHGFTRAPGHLAAFSESCQRRGWNCLRPTLAPRLLPVLMNSRRHLDEVADRLIASGRLCGSVVIVGHSAGAAAGTWMTPYLIAAGIDVRGLVYVDGNDSPNYLIKKAWPLIQTVPIAAVLSPPSPCNRHGALAEFLTARRPESVQIVEGSGHGDFEMTGAPVYRWVCRDTSSVNEWRLVQTAVLDAVGSLLEDS